MKANWYQLCCKVTPEERMILEQESGGIQRELYTGQQKFIVEQERLSEDGSLITARQHTRFVHFPPHCHDYVEVFYVLFGSVTHIIEGKKITVHTGELLFMNQYVAHEILPCGKDDIAMNLIIMPEFLEHIAESVGKNNILADFLVNVLQEKTVWHNIYTSLRQTTCVFRI